MRPSLWTRQRSGSGNRFMRRTRICCNPANVSLPDLAQYQSSLGLTFAILVTPGITALEYAQRRSRLAAHLPANGLAVVAAAELKYRSGAVFYEFHQDSNFFYLTGHDRSRSHLCLTEV